MKSKYYTYILASYSRRLYIGVTRNLKRRVEQHKAGTGSKFTKQYAIKYLVYFETFQYVDQAIQRENQLKGLDRAKKLKIIEAVNPDYVDLADL
ncbi:MAG: GIY-YIG nuclease family protein [Cyanobacteria bacterium]|nr:GIY-YIG nuclease family protein [Cyanobacteriota bacterium]